MLPDMDVMNCQSLAVPYDVMHHVASIESSWNPYAIGVVGARLVRQPRSLGEAVATARLLESRGYNFSVGLAQVNRYNLPRYGLQSYREAFDGCTNLRVGASILSNCLDRSGHDWGRALSCYYSGNFVTGFRAGYVQKVLALWRRGGAGAPDAGRGAAIAVTRASRRHMSRIEASTAASDGAVASAIAPTAAAGGTHLATTDSAAVLALQPAMPAVPDNAPPAAPAPVPDLAFVF